MDESILILLVTSLVLLLLCIGMLVALVPQCNQRYCTQACRNKGTPCPGPQGDDNKKARTGRASKELGEVPG